MNGASYSHRSTLSFFLIEQENLSKMVAIFTKNFYLARRQNFENNKVVSKTVVRTLEEYPPKKFSLKLKVEAVVQRYSVKKVFSQNFRIFTGKHLC